MTVAAPNRRITMVYAVSRNGVIGRDNKLPWHYAADLQRFKQLTTGHTIVMGRRTFESIGRALPNRRNIVVTAQSLNLPGVECFSSLSSAIAATTGEVFLIGGARIFAEGMAFADRIDVTLIPEEIEGAHCVYAPSIDPLHFSASEFVTNAADPRLSHRVYSRL